MNDTAHSEEAFAELARALGKHYLADEQEYLGELVAGLDDEADRAAIGAACAELIGEVRARPDAVDGIDRLLQEYSLSTQEGVLLMCLAEALLRIPDAATADALIEDKLGAADWHRHLGHSDSLLVNASTWGLLLTGRLVRLEAAATSGPLRRLLARLGEPVIRRALYQAMQLLGQQFVLGRDITEALRRSQAATRRGDTYSYDMLGEAARTGADAERYRAAYLAAIEAVGAQPPTPAGGAAAGISIKLSALHPRYERSQRERLQRELVPVLAALVARARELGVAVTLDAEEQDRLELSLQLFATVQRQVGQGWDGFGLAVQAYSKRALPVLRWLAALAGARGDRIPVRLVKGAYWDSEIKLAQQLGLAGYPVFTRKAGTDVSYLACARYLLSPAASLLRPQFASHNAHTVVSVLRLAAGRPLEFQRLHGMGEALLRATLARAPAGSYCRIYAPVGAHRELLPYLVRRLLENGANSSFVHQLVDPRVPIEELSRHPAARLAAADGYANPAIPPPPALYGSQRANARGLNLAVDCHLLPLLAALRSFDDRQWEARPLLADTAAAAPGPRRAMASPADAAVTVGHVEWASEAQARAAVTAAAAAFPGWDATPVAQRAALVSRLADLLEQHMPELIALCAREAGKTLPDGLAEVREAVDFCRYYSQQARELFQPRPLPGPTGERNELYLGGRGVFAAISPWNFPIAIFVGQVSAALLAGNTVLAKPAEQSSLLAHRVAELMYAAGIPRDVLQLLPGDGAALGRVLCSDPRLAGVAFTGSTETAQAINRLLAAREGAPLPALIAETGGLNAMIVDSSALAEQVVIDVVDSAFTSAGQRCSALRVLFLQEEIAPGVLAMLAGAMQELRLGDPREIATDVGPLIDREAWRQLQAHCETLRGQGRLLAETPLPPGLAARGPFLAPAAFALDTMGQLTHEQFGPVLHVIRYRAAELDTVLAQINASGYGLTLGIHSRNEGFARRVEAGLRVGNVYVNRNMIGAVVGVQPFGGMGLSGTGPKAGGPHYLLRFAAERTRSVNTAAAGGNPSLLGLG